MLQNNNKEFIYFLCLVFFLSVIFLWLIMNADYLYGLVSWFFFLSSNISLNRNSHNKSFSCTFDPSTVKKKK